MITAYQAEFDADIDLIAKSASHIDQLYAQWRELSEDKLSIPKAKRTDWRTPAWLFNELNKEFNFDIDVAASAENAKCKIWLGKQDDALVQNWHAPDLHNNCSSASLVDTRSVFLNPPFDQATQFLQKALEQRQFMRNIVMLLPYRAGTRWFRDLVWRPLFSNESTYTQERGFVEIISHIGDYYYSLSTFTPFNGRANAGELRILTKRLAFDDQKKVAAFDCCVVVFRGNA